MDKVHNITIEGFTPEQILNLPREEFDALILTNAPVVFKAGTASILGRFNREGTHLTIELGHVDGGGEGVLPVLWSLAERYAKEYEVNSMDWIVHAVTCDPPNPRLRRLLERRGFEVRDMQDIGPVYYFRKSLVDLE